MKIVVLAVGGIRGPLAQVVRDYQVRAERYWKVEVEEVDAGAPGRKSPPRRIREVEGERLRSRIGKDDDAWIITREGTSLDSVGWARALGDQALHGGRDLYLVVGGAFGIASRLKREARRRVSLAPVTLPHEIARLVLMEQLYRAGTILRNEPYHKGAS